MKVILLHINSSAGVPRSWKAGFPTHGDAGIQVPSVLGLHNVLGPLSTQATASRGVGSGRILQTSLGGAIILLMLRSLFARTL